MGILCCCKALSLPQTRLSFRAGQPWKRKILARRREKMNAIVVFGGGLIFLGVVAIVVAIVVAARRPPAPAPADAPRTIGEAVAGAHDGLDDYVVRTIDVVAAALGSAVPAPIFVSAAPAPAPEPEPAPAPRTIGEAVAQTHESLDDFIVRTIDGVGLALAAAVPAKVFVGAAPAAPDAAPAAAQKDFATRSAKAEYDRVLALFK